MVMALSRRAHRTFAPRMARQRTAVVLLAATLQWGGALAATVTSDAPLTNYAISSQASQPIQLSLEASSYRVTFSNGGFTPGMVPSALGGLVRAMNDNKIQISGGGTAVINEQIIQQSVRTELRAGISYTGTVDALEVNTGNQVVDSIMLGGGFNWTAAPANGVTDTLSIGNLRANLGTGAVTADVAYTSILSDTGAEAYPGANFSAKDVRLWQASGVSADMPLQTNVLNALFDGDQAPIQGQGYAVTSVEGSEISPGTITYVNGNPIYNPYYLTYGYGSPYPIGYEQVPVETGAVNAVNAHLVKTISLSGLHLTEEGKGILMGAPIGQEGLFFTSSIENLETQPEGWGSISAIVRISASVPEPSTYLLMALGLVGTFVAARRAQPARV